MLIVIAMDQLQQRWRQPYWQAVHHNPAKLAEGRNHLIAFGAVQEKLDDPEYFRESHLQLLIKSYQEAEPGQWTFDFLHHHIKANPDINCKAATHGRRLGYTVFEKTNPYNSKDESESMGFSHLKKRLTKKGLITVQKAHVVSEQRNRKDESTYHHRYVEKTKKTIWYRPDQITINHAVFYAATNAA